MTRILAVDDEPLLLELVVEELEMHGFVVEAAGDGEIAKSMLASDPDYDVLVTDLRMPGKVDGLALARYFLDQNGHGRVIYVTGFAEIPQSFSARETLLRKPFRMGQLVSLIETS